MDYFQFTEACFIPCEICGSTAVDIHHIEPRGMGGSKDKDTIENLMAVCRRCHEDYGDKKQFKQWLKDIHTAIMKKWSSVKWK